MASLVSVRRAFVLLGLCLAAVAVWGCQSQRDLLPEDTPASASSAGDPASPPEGIELSAHARGNMVQVTLTNHHPFLVLAGPRSFGVIENGKRKVIPFRIGIDAAQLPIKRLNQGESIQGLLRFKTLRYLAGSRLVFNSDEAPPGLLRNSAHG